MPAREPVDVAILGAGPAGCCAALRLLALGHGVALVERRPFPRPQIGEALSPGVGEILDYIGAAAAMRAMTVRSGLPARVLWQSREPELVPPQVRGPGLVVDRAEFDARLLKLVAERGGEVIQPSRARRIEGVAGNWRLVLGGADGSSARLRSRMILDATGRPAQSTAQRFATAPATFALWSEVAESVMPGETRLEALPKAWLWGTPLANGHYRIMAFVDPADLKRRSGLEAFFRKMLGASELFEAAARVDLASPVRACSATPYLALDPFQPGILKVGEKAFAIDPLSSSGVEKAMRSALQAAIAANTLLSDPAATGLVEDFYESSLLESATTHAVWTRDFYRQAWPGRQQSFWLDRSGPLARGPEQPGLIRRFHEACARREASGTDPPEPENGDFLDHPDAGRTLAAILGAPVHISSELRFVQVPCVVADRVQLRAAVTHPSLKRPLAFLDGCDLVPLLEAAPGARSLGDLIALWTASMPAPKAARIAGWLRKKGMLRIDAPVAAPSVPKGAR